MCHVARHLICWFCSVAGTQTGLQIHFFPFTGQTVVWSDIVVSLWTKGAICSRPHFHDLQKASASIALLLCKKHSSIDRRKEGRCTHPWQPAKLIGWNSVWAGQCHISHDSASIDWQTNLALGLESMSCNMPYMSPMATMATIPVHEDERHTCLE